MNVTLRRDGTRRGRKILATKKKVFKIFFGVADTGTRQTSEFPVIPLGGLQHLMKNVTKRYDNYIWL
jgi:hypothetical protein